MVRVGCGLGGMWFRGDVVWVGCGLGGTAIMAMDEVGEEMSEGDMSDVVGMGGCGIP